MDEAVIAQLEDVLKGLQKIRAQVWANDMVGRLPIDHEISILEDVIGQMTYKENWNGTHPIGMT